MHWACSYQRCAKQVVAKATGKESKRLEIEAFCLFAAQITKASSQHEVFKLTLVQIPNSHSAMKSLSDVINNSEDCSGAISSTPVMKFISRLSAFAVNVCCLMFNTSSQQFLRNI